MRHLDIGCGGVPRNPFHADELFGVDVQPASAVPAGVTFVQANVVLQGLPFPDNHFDSLSAYDVIEHIPRQLFIPERGLVLPFVEFMNEVHRVLKPGGVLLATTPGFPSNESMQDPTHVNYITLATADYFCRPDRKARIYGFHGDFTALTNRWCCRNSWVDAHTPNWRRLTRRWHRRLLRGGCVDVVWQFRSEKQAAA